MFPYCCSEVTDVCSYCCKQKQDKQQQKTLFSYLLCHFRLIYLPCKVHPETNSLYCSAATICDVCWSRLISNCGKSMSCHVNWSTEPARPLKLTDHKDQSPHMDRSETIYYSQPDARAVNVKRRWRDLLYQSTTILRPS